MQRVHTAVVLCVLALALSACSGGDEHPDAGTRDAGDVGATFGLGLGRCYEFSDTSTTLDPPALGVAVEGTQTKPEYLADGGAPQVTALRVVYRKTGQVKMVDSLYVDGSQVLLLDRDVTGAEETEYRPAVPLFQLPLVSGDHLDQPGQTRTFGAGDGGLQDADFAFDVVKEPIATPAAPDGGDAFTYQYAGAFAHLSSASVVPGTGLVQLSVAFAGESGAPVYKLQATRALDVDAGDQSCGTATP